jgi:hypothetical protein
MSTQWHPLFAHLLRLQLEAYYQIHAEMPISELPRRGDIILIRREAKVSPPFNGLWAHLTEWNILEFKGPTDDAQEADLDLLLHVGTGIAFRLNEERRERGETVMPNHRVALWLLAPSLSDAMKQAALRRADFGYEGGGLWRGRVWGHPIFLVSYTDLAVEPDGLPLFVLRRESPPQGLKEMLVTRLDLLRTFQEWLAGFQPRLLEEVLNVVRQDGNELGIDYQRAIKFFDPNTLVDALGGVEKVIQLLGREKLLQRLLSTLTPEERERLLRPSDNPDPPTA